jgi:cell division protein FtsI (penicillin-binding protein 3)
VLALANFPSYVPDKRRNLTGEQLRNRALTDTFEPGSVMKPFTVGLGLETGRVTPQTLIDTGNGKFNITGSTISDSHPNGVLTVEGVIQKSSNIGTAKIAMQMDRREMWELFSQAGFGQKPQISFPGAVSGRLRPFKTWRPIEQATMSYGYGLSASLFQMARSYTVFSHDGQIIPVTMLKNSEPAVGTQVLSEKTANQVRKMLQMAAGLQTDWQELRQRWQPQIPGLVCRHGAHREAAHHRGGDDRRTNCRAILRWRRGRARVQ